jgi:DNA-binding HxlR family transcriptional regulator
MIGDKWTLLLLHTLHGRTVRYLQLQREIEGISQKMLSQTLFGLERHGLVYRKVYAVVPPRVEYSLTPLGESLVPRLSPLLEWCEASYSSVEKAKAEYDAKRASLAEDLSL